MGVYCDNHDHMSIDCQKVVTVGDCKQVLGDKRLCLNCMGSKQRAADCKSRSACQHCHSFLRTDSSQIFESILAIPHRFVLLFGFVFLMIY